MSTPTLERRPTHKAFPLLRSEISRISHRRLFRVLSRMVAVQLIEKTQLSRLPRRTDFLGRVEIQDWLFAAPQGSTLVNRRHKPGAPVAIPAGHLLGVFVGKDHERGQVGVLGSQTIADPTSQ